MTPTDLEAKRKAYAEAHLHYQRVNKPYQPRLTDGVDALAKLTSAAVEYAEGAEADLARTNGLLDDALQALLDGGYDVHVEYGRLVVGKQEAAGGGGR